MNKSPFRASGGNQSYCYLEVGLLASRTGREDMSVPFSHLACDGLHGSPEGAFWRKLPVSRPLKDGKELLWRYFSQRNQLARGP